MEAEEMEVVQLELKYCERCGGLWLRLQGSAEVYCTACVADLSEYPAPRTKSRPRLPVNHKMDNRSERLGPVVICGSGGNA